MKDKCIRITLEQAKKWYKSDTKELKELALSVYTEEQLKQEEWETITSFKDAARALGVYYYAQSFLDANTHLPAQLRAIYKLNIIKQALNGDWEPSMDKGTIYWPVVKVFKALSQAKEWAKENDSNIDTCVEYDGVIHYIAGSCSASETHNGMSANISRKDKGTVLYGAGMFGCKSKEIAAHMSKYFAAIIFTATYGGSLEHRFV